MIYVACFLPGRRTASTFAAGTLDMRWRRFAGADLPAAAIWAAYVTTLGYLGGEAFKNSTWKPLAVSLAIGGAVALAGEVVRRVSLRDRGGRRSDRDEGEPLIKR